MDDNFDLNTFVSLGSHIIAIASIITALTPTPRDDQILHKFYRIIEILALLVGRAKDTKK